jgi:hypothetical protein
MKTVFITDIDPPPPTAEEMEASNRRNRETVALWVFNDNFEENGFLHGPNWATVKKEFMKTNPYFEQSIEEPSTA